MAIDSSLYVAHITAAQYTGGVPVAMECVKGPAVVRDGYGTAVMKRITTFCTTLEGTAKVRVQNSGWIDYMANNLAGTNSSQAFTSFSAQGPNVQSCGNVELQPNSDFTVSFVPDETITYSGEIDVYCLIDIDYPSVSAVANPKTENGAPVTIEYTNTVTTSIRGADLDWAAFNVDLFKAGYRYLLVNPCIVANANGANQFGFIAISGAAGQSGLSQIIPCIVRPSGAMRLDYDYSNVFVKGPMTLEFAVVDNTSGASAATESVYLELDCIRR